MTSEVPLGRPRRTRRRWARLARPQEQLRSTLPALGWAAIAAAVLAATGSDDGGDIASLGVSFAVVGAACVLATLAATQRFAGPLRRFELYFERLARGEDPGPCRLRDGDRAQELCVLVNRVTEPLRKAGGLPAAPETVAGEEPLRSEERVRSSA